MTTATDPADIAVSHKGDLGDDPRDVAAANAGHCPACAWLVGYTSATVDAESIWPIDDREWRRAARRPSDAIQQANARARADRPGTRPGDRGPGPAQPWQEDDHTGPCDCSNQPGNTTTRRPS